MTRIIRETRLTAVLKKFSQDQCILLADYTIDISPQMSLNLGYEQKLLTHLECFGGMKAFEVTWPVSNQYALGIASNFRARKRLFFFAHTEQDVIGRLAVAEVLLF